MQSLSLYATTAPAGRGWFRELSTNNAAIPTVIVLPRRKIGAFPDAANGNNLGRFSFKLKAQYFAPQKQDNQQQGISPFESPFPSLPGQFPPRVYVGYYIYKGKAAIKVQPMPPVFSTLGSGAFKLSKEGYISLQFAPAAGVRQYDWGKKQLFSLSVTEIGNIISLGARESCEFFHDPLKGKSDEGRVRKILKVEPLPDGSGHFFNLSVQNKITNVEESIYIPITRAEFAVLVSLFNFILPHLMGWHTFANTIKPDDSNRTNSGKPGSAADFEWNR